MDFRFNIIDFSNYDGDSFDLTLDLGFDLVIHQKCRLEGIDTPELRGGDERHKAAGYLARDEARRFVKDAMDVGGAVFVSETYRGKFGRPLGDIVRVGDGRSLRDELLERRLGVPYHGQAKSEVAALHLENIERLVEQGQIQ